MNTALENISAEAWVTGPDGQRYWGRFGAAGIVVRDSTDRVLLQLRAAWTDRGGLWGIPGGALASGESAIDGALREAGEECGLPADAVTVQGTHEFDLGFWKYTTVIADMVNGFRPSTDFESLEHRWVPVDDVESLPLHPAFRSSWPAISEMIK